jgi:hypothetical protein
MGGNLKGRLKDMASSRELYPLNGGTNMTNSPDAINLYARPLAAVSVAKFNTVFSIVSQSLHPRQLCVSPRSFDNRQSPTALRAIKHVAGSWNSGLCDLFPLKLL